MLIIIAVTTTTIFLLLLVVFPGFVPGRGVGGPRPELLEVAIALLLGARERRRQPRRIRGRRRGGWRGGQRAAAASVFILAAGHRSSSSSFYDRCSSSDGRHLSWWLSLGRSVSRQSSQPSIWPVPCRCDGRVLCAGHARQRAVVLPAGRRYTKSTGVWKLVQVERDTDAQMAKARGSASISYDVDDEGNNERLFASSVK